MLSALDVASFFLSTKDEEDNLTQLKLQKLLYYSQGYALVFLNRPLFEEAIINWEHGPVVEIVWREYSHYGKTPIDHIDADLSKYAGEELVLLEEVKRDYGQFSAWKLRNMTHEEAPWKETNRNEEMSHAIIKRFFEQYLRGEKKEENAFNYDLERMKARVENQDFVTVPDSALESNKAFRDWLETV